MTPHLTLPEQPPPVLYKYYPPERLDIFQTFQVRFSNPAQFNDVFDSTFGGQARKTAEHYKFRLHLGILCLTEDPDNQLMWVHYAARHSGFVIGFNTRDRIFTEHNATLRRVKYGQPCDYGVSPPSLDLCLHKESVWAYEKEWRCIRQCSRDIPNEAEISQTTINPIILGADILRGHAVEIMQQVEVMNNQLDFKVTIQQSMVNFANRTICHEPPAEGLCDKCGGKGTVKVLPPGH
jgi:hypothetical protein